MQILNNVDFLEKYRIILDYTSCMIFIGKVRVQSTFFEGSYYSIRKSNEIRVPVTENNLVLPRVECLVLTAYRLQRPSRHRRTRTWSNHTQSIRFITFWEPVGDVVCLYHISTQYVLKSPPLTDLLNENKSFKQTARERTIKKAVCQAILIYSGNYAFILMSVSKS